MGKLGLIPKIIAELMIISRLSKGNLRFGQIIGNATSGDQYYTSDADMLRALVAYRQMIENNTESQG